MEAYKTSFMRVIQSEADAIASLLETVDQDTVARIVDLLIKVKKEKRRVITVGCGTSGAAAKKIAHSLCCVEIPATFLSPATAAHGAMGYIQRGDVVVMVTKGGNTAEILGLLPCCKEKGATIIGVSENESSRLAQAADIFLKVRIEREPCPWGLLATASTLAVIAVWDAIIITAMQHNGFTKEQFLLIHPGGAVGEKLAH
ncbi:MAG: SIS domain-containing protein [Christensenellaceae bacterium]|nr:SIS domain-containing protein [Christensenellaceae bacterium]